MNCPNCNKPMSKARWEVTNNLKTGEDFKEYDKYTYECKSDDIWVTTETPITKSQKISLQNSSGLEKHSAT